MSNFKIIATIGDVSGMNLGDMGKPSFVRLGAPASDPHLPQGTVHLADYYGDHGVGLTLVAFMYLSIRLWDDDEDFGYYPTGAVLYESDDSPASIWLLASVKMTDSEPDMSVAGEIDQAAHAWSAALSARLRGADPTRAELLRLGELWKAEELDDDEDDELDRLRSKYAPVIAALAGIPAEPMGLAFVRA